MAWVLRRCVATCESVSSPPQGDEVEEEDSDTVVKQPAVLVVNESLLPKTLEQLFATLLNEMEGLINLGDKLDG